MTTSELSRTTPAGGEIKGPAIDLAVSLISAALIGAAGYLTRRLAPDQMVQVPLWLFAGAAVSIGVGTGVAWALVSRTRLLNRARLELTLMTTELAATRKELATSTGMAVEARAAAEAAAARLRQMRDLSRAVAQVIREDPSALTREVSYTVDPDGADRIESTWTIGFASEHQGRVFVAEDWSTYPPTGEVTSASHSDDQPGTSALAIQIVDEPTRKSSAIYLHPPVGLGPRQLRLLQTWPGLWKDLRDSGADYVEVTARPGLQRTETKVHIPLSMGRFRWQTSADGAVALQRTDSGAQQTLSMVVVAPQAGRTYRADIVRE